MSATHLLHFASRLDQQASERTLKLLVKQKRKKYTCVLAAPTGTASFQMKYGAATAHSTWGVPVGKCCLPLKRGAQAFERLQEMLQNCDLAVFDEFSMLGLAFIGKILVCLF